MKQKFLSLISFYCVCPFICSAEATNELTNTQKWITFMPAIFFIVILAGTIIKLRRDRTKLSDLLAEKDKIPVEGTKDGAQPGEVSPQKPPQSVSRFIAFLCGVTTLTIAVCITTFYFYTCFEDRGKEVDLSKLSTVLLALGIGVLPYGFNKASSAIKTN